MALPGVSSVWIDGQLSQPTPDVTRSNSVLVIGTAEDGPLYEPIPIRTVADAKAVFGSFGAGTLVRGLEEVFLSAGAPVDLRGMRLGGGKRARVAVKESDGTTGTLAEEQDTEGGYAIVLEARQPGNIYNQVTIGYRDGRTVEIFNPKTGLVSRFDYDSNRDNTSADVHTVAELVDAINADPNLNSILTAVYRILEARYEINARYGDGLESDAQGNWAAAASGILVDSAGRTSITLSDRTIHWTNPNSNDAGNTTASGVLAANLLDNQPPSGSYTSGNNIQNLIRVYSIADIGEPERLFVAGQSSGTLKRRPLAVAGRSLKQTFTALKDYDSDGQFFLSPSGGATAVSEFRQVYERLFIGTGDGVTTVFKWNAPVVMDSWDLNVHTGSLVYDAVNTGSNVISTSTAGYDADLGDVIVAIVEKDGRLVDWSGQTVTASGSFSLMWDAATIGRPVTEYTLSWDGSAATATAYGAPRATVTFTTAPPNGTNLYVTYKSASYTIPENTTLAANVAESSAWDNWRRYFVAGQQVYFGAPVPSDIEVRYMGVTNYEPGTQVELIRDPAGRQGDAPQSNTYSTVRFNDPANQPGPGASGLVNTADTVIGFQYDFLPEWPDMTSFKNLSGGTNGTNLTTDALYTELGTAYDAIQNYPVDLIVPMSATVDAVRTVANRSTGLAQPVNAGFHTQLATVLNAMTENVDETLGILGVQAPGSTTPQAVNDWVDKLTVVVPGQITRAANVMASFDERLISIVAFEPVFVNDFEGASPYSANGQAAYAGLIASLAPNAGTTNKLLRGLVNLRYHLSRKQLERMMNARYVTANRSINSPGQFVVTAGDTAAAPGSDFSKLSTVRIVKQAIAVVRAVCDPFIGTANSPAAQVAMRTAITAGLKAMVEINALRGYDFQIVSTPAMQVAGLVDVELILVPAFEIRRIRAIVRLRATA